MPELITMSSRELDRLEVVRRIRERRLTCAKAGELLGSSERQVQRLCRAFDVAGPAGLASKKRGRPSNRRLPEDLRERAVALVRERYADFGPTLAQEKLLEHHDVRVGRETLRKWLTAAGVWPPRRERLREAQQPRARCDCCGELVQIDGCQHDWFEGRGPYCTLLVFVDDATGRLMELRFVPSESAFDYFRSTIE
jgi:transposase